MMKTRSYSLQAVAALLAAALFCNTALAENASQAPINKTRTHFQALLKEKPGFYPACRPAAIRPRQEDFQKGHLTLSGLPGVYLNVDGLLKSASKKNTKLMHDLKKRVVHRLAKGNLRLLTKEEMIRTPGQPEMNIYMTLPAHLSPAKKGKKPVTYRPDCCKMSTWASFSQAAQIMRDPETNYKFGTWGKGHNTTDCSDPAAWMSKVILATVDSFVADKLKGDKDYAAWMEKRAKQPKNTQTAHQQLKKAVKQELAALQGVQAKPGAQGKAQVQTIKQQKPAAVKPIQQQRPVAVKPAPVPAPATPTMPINCNGAVRTYIDMFATNQVHIDHANYYVLDVLAANMRACPMYNYIIETHADLRSDFEHNDRLSALRAATIQGHLIARGVSKSQFITQSFGEIKPVSRGLTTIDHAANRRIVVRPYLRR